jgi:hypothetical protein
LPAIVVGCAVASTVRVAFCKTCTFPVTVAFDSVQLPPLGTTTLPVMFPLKLLVQLASAARTAEAPPTSAGMAKASANANVLIAFPPNVTILTRFYASILPPLAYKRVRAKSIADRLKATASAPYSGDRE